MGQTGRGRAGDAVSTWSGAPLPLRAWIERGLGDREW